MTEKNEQKRNTKIPISQHSPFHIEIDRTAGGISVLCGGIIGIKDFSRERVELSSHGGRIIIRGNALGASVYEHGACEVTGKVLGVDFIYGKG